MPTVAPPVASPAAGYRGVRRPYSMSRTRGDESEGEASQWHFMRIRQRRPIETYRAERRRAAIAFEADINRLARNIGVVCLRKKRQEIAKLSRQRMVKQLNVQRGGANGGVSWLEGSRHLRIAGMSACPDRNGQYLLHQRLSAAAQQASSFAISSARVADRRR